jgi:hypothetical protein
MLDPANGREGLKNLFDVLYGHVKLQLDAPASSVL